MTDQTVLHVPQSEIHDAFIRACNEELQALKPGNVHVFAPGHDMDVAQFEMSATAAAPYIADPELSVGARIKGAVKASMKAAGCNTNLGIVLLCAPLAAAAGRVQAEANVSERLKATLADLTPQDADDVFAAIR
ncbi:MAG: triphosphoribosyl-dephospho-CoA synthase, partial [Alphaproteobacteria bacterium]|nr:triphosphoribosyl-dephospho-CoA synthase [Alphaproteobacteria bacterium]